MSRAIRLFEEEGLDLHKRNGAQTRVWMEDSGEYTTASFELRSRLLWMGGAGVCDMKNGIFRATGTFEPRPPQGREENSTSHPRWKDGTPTELHYTALKEGDVNTDVKKSPLDQYCGSALLRAATSTGRPFQIIEKKQMVRRQDPVLRRIVRLRKETKHYCKSIQGGIPKTISRMNKQAIHINVDFILRLLMQHHSRKEVGVCSCSTSYIEKREDPHGPDPDCCVPRTRTHISSNIATTSCTNFKKAEARKDEACLVTHPLPHLPRLLPYTSSASPSPPARPPSTRPPSRQLRAVRSYTSSDGSGSPPA